MEHDVFEQEMIDGVNRHAEMKWHYTGTHESATPVEKSGFIKEDVRILMRGLKRIVLALLTTFLFALSVFDFIAVATATGYWAVALFITAISMLTTAFILLYVQGITYMESKGDDK
jgi:hypothetical protein